MFILDVFFNTFCYPIAQTGKLFAQYHYFDHFDPKKDIFDPQLTNFWSKVKNNHRNEFLDPKNIPVE